MALLYIKNPNASNKTIYIHRLSFGSDFTAIVNSYRDPTVVGGTLLTPVNRTGGSTVSIAQIYGQVTGGLFTSFSGGTFTRRRYIPANDERDGLEEGTLTIPMGHSILWAGNVTTNSIHEISSNVIWWER